MSIGVWIARFGISTTSLFMLYLLFLEVKRYWNAKDFENCACYCFYSFLIWLIIGICWL